MVLDKKQRDTLSRCVMVYAATYNFYRGFKSPTVDLILSDMCLDLVVDVLSAVGIKVDYIKGKNDICESVIIDGYTYIL